MTRMISKSRFKAQALELLQRVERTGEEIVITDRGRPMVKLTPYAADPLRQLSELRKAVVRYDAPEEPVGTDDWEALEP